LWFENVRAERPHTSAGERREHGTEQAAACNMGDGAVTHYSILQVRPSATLREIKAAFRRLALETHPDRGGDAAAFARVAEAFEVLRHGAKRAEYDASLDRPDYAAKSRTVFRSSQNPSDTTIFNFKQWEEGHYPASAPPMHRQRPPHLTKQQAYFDRVNARTPKARSFRAVVTGLRLFLA
jgi:curved DNA-binding protein CbpA